MRQCGAAYGIAMFTKQHVSRPEVSVADTLVVGLQEGAIAIIDALADRAIEAESFEGVCETVVGMAVDELGGLVVADGRAEGCG